MKKTALPALRVDTNLRDASEKVLRSGETLSMLMETALASYIAQREAEGALLRRGLASAQNARKQSDHIGAMAVLGKLTKKLAVARKNDSR